MPVELSQRLWGLQGPHPAGRVRSPLTARSRTAVALDGAGAGAPRLLPVSDLRPRLGGHRRSAAGHLRPVRDPMLSYRVRAFDERLTRRLTMRYDEDDAGIE